MTAKSRDYDAIQDWVIRQLTNEQTVKATEAELIRGAARIKSQAERMQRALHAVRQDDERDRVARLAD